VRKRGGRERRRDGRRDPGQQDPAEKGKHKNMTGTPHRRAGCQRGKICAFVRAGRKGEGGAR